MKRWIQEYPIYSMFSHTSSIGVVVLSEIIWHHGENDVESLRMSIKPPSTIDISTINNRTHLVVWHQLSYHKSAIYIYIKILVNPPGPLLLVKSPCSYCFFAERSPCSIRKLRPDWLKYDSVDDDSEPEQARSLLCGCACNYFYGCRKGPQFRIAKLTHSSLGELLVLQMFIGDASN